MKYDEIASKFYKKLQDDESRKLFEIRLKEMENNTWGVLLYDYISKSNYKFILSEYDDFRKIYNNKKIIIRGAGICGRITYNILQGMGLDAECFCDEDERKQKEGYLGKKVIPERELITNFRDRFVIIASREYGNVLYGSLISKSFPRENVFLPRIGVLYAVTGKQYFDCPEMEAGCNEVFVDCGCYDADSSRQFIDWCSGRYEKIIAFEPDKILYSKIKENCSIPRFELYPFASGAARGEMAFFSTADGGSRIMESGSEKVAIETIDHVLGKEKATFIKLDVEGAELETLRGAEYTIKTFKPRLAVSIYHKPADIIEIPKFLMEIRDDYRFYIRHYTSCHWETILYAV